MAKQEVGRKRTILCFQPFSVYGNGGGPRIMRRLVEGREDEIIFFSFAFRYPAKGENPREVPYVLFPAHKDWMRSFLRTFFYYLRHTVFYKYNMRRVNAIVSKLKFDVLHVLDHSFYSNLLLPIAKERGVPVWVSFHDHFNTTSSQTEVTRDLWNIAEKRMVISHEMGRHYSELFGEQPYLIVSDGLKPEEISPVMKEARKDSISVYFGGLLHVDYYELFENFAKALELFAKEQNKSVTLILRGTQKLSFLNESSFKIEYRPFSINTEELRLEMNEAEILYLPMKYNDKDFYKYSFSTKMIGYLGASGNIFYHGPADSAAAIFLEKNKCGVICDSLDPKQILPAINETLKDFSYSLNAKKVASEDYKLANMQDRFFEAKV